LSRSDNQHRYAATIKKRRPQKSLQSAIINTIITSLPAAASHSPVVIQIVAQQPGRIERKTG